MQEADKPEETASLLIETPKEEAKLVANVSAAQIVKILGEAHDPKQWAFFDELRIGTGYGKDAEQRFDAWAIHYFPSKRNVSRCYEIKISRSDFKSEIRKPLKRRPGLRLANEFYFVTPENLLDPAEIPPECGLMEVNSKGNLKIKLQAPFRDIMPPTWLFMSAICRRLDRERYTALNAKFKADAYQRMAEIATNIALERHLDRWRKHNSGSREIPDRIVQALEDVKYEVDEIIKIQEGKVDIL
jgi:hypothetical protein